MTTAYAVSSPESGFKKIEYDPGELHPDEVDIAVEYCGVCHSDLSMKNNDWGLTEYPFVGGHEIAGKVIATGDRVQHLAMGQRVGVGWTARSCMHCNQCLSGYQNRCPEAQGTIVGRHGGFADRVRAQSEWVIPVPDDVDLVDCGPLFCGGLTVFSPLIENNIQPTDHVAVVGIGGLGHLALQFARSWGCHVTAFSTSPDKEDEAKSMGAHQFLNSRDEQELSSAAGQFDMILVTVNADLPWDAYIGALKPGGKLHLVGAAESINATVFPLIMGEKSIGASLTGGIVRARQMMEFCSRHAIRPMIEKYPMADIDEAMDRLESGKARYRVVLEA